MNIYREYAPVVSKCFKYLTSAVLRVQGLTRNYCIGQW